MIQGKKILGLLLAALLFAVPARAADDITVVVEGETVPAFVEDGVTYVQLTSLLASLGGWEAAWDQDQCTAMAETDMFTLGVPIQRGYVLADGYSYWTGQAALLRENRTYVPLRSVSNLLGAQVDFVDWNTPVAVRMQAGISYTEEDLYWLSRIISAESRGESLTGQVAVGNVILNRVAAREFPNTIKDVIFDKKDGVQFEPVANLTVYDEPAEQSVLAARLALAGVDVVGNCLYFFNPAYSQGLWVRQNRVYSTTIGGHMFFQ